ncbi:MAG: hypothetical protein IJT25_00825, partial [Clostridia bacterium]|nr:hypothetical protein [Clostridia bacterium]
MEENTQGEQSQISENYMELAKQEMNETENKKEDITRNFDSPYGKFKDAKSLLSAYNSLEAEFTRKSQKLASLLSNGNTLSKDNDALQSQKTTINNSENNGEQISASENKESAIKFKQSGW